ncbi:MAG TPA: tetratricopeptide repeat-containing glycosyltransferase family protein [Prosthecobacter sp.]
MTTDNWQTLAMAHLRRGDFVSAMELCDGMVKQEPRQAEAHGMRGCVLRGLGRWEEALQSFDRAIQLRPDYAEAHNNRGIVLRDLARLEDALACHEHAIRIKADYANAWKNRGIVLHDLKRFEEALASHEHVIRLCPEDAQAHNCRGNVLHRLRRLDEAVESYTRAVALSPDYAEAYHNRSISLRELRRVAEAVESCEKAVAIRPNYAEPWWNMAELLILAGHYARGWPMFDWRWKSAEYGKVFRQLDRPVWRGDEDIIGKTILVNLDGGFGDTLNFCRYAPLLEQRGARVILEVQAGLVTLLQHSLSSMQVIANGQPLPPFDCHCPMMSLPGAFALPLAQIPATLPYLRVPEGQPQRWKARLGSKTRPRIGLVWSGSTDHSNDFQRSMSAEMMRLLTTLDAEFHCLQKEIRTADRAAVSALPIKTWEAELADFADTAALVMQMDIVVSVDTSVAHLAGALGRSVWVLLPYVPDMRWLLAREDSPWYPEVMRLFRQDPSRAWETVVEKVHGELHSLLHS